MTRAEVLLAKEHDWLTERRQRYEKDVLDAQATIEQRGAHIAEVDREIAEVVMAIALLKASDPTP